jgi:ankyrin repeat protein
MSDSLQDLVASVRAGKVDEVRSALARNPGLEARLDEPHPDLPFDGTPLLSAVARGDRALIQVLLDAGANINVRSGWWAGGFGVLDSAPPDLAAFLIERGAAVDAHAAARLGMLDRLEALVSADPQVVHARGGDGQRPLHFASNVEVARLLLDRGADIDATDVDHESTAAQYMVRDRQAVARYLVGRGCRTDILLAAALGDENLVRRHLDRDPDAVDISVSDRHFPKLDPRAGGSIYIWTLGSNKTPHAIAREFGHGKVFSLLMERSPSTRQLSVACEIGDEQRVAALLAESADLASRLGEEDRRRPAAAAQNNNTRAVRLMLGAGWPPDVRGPQDGTALHWAAFHGNAEMTRDLLRYVSDVNVRDGEHDATPLGWALYGSKYGWHCRTGDYVGTAQALLEAGATRPQDIASAEMSDAVRVALFGR